MKSPKEKRYQYLAFNVNIMRLMGLWLEEGGSKFSDARLSCIMIFFLPIYGPVLVDMTEIIDPNVDLILKIQITLASSCIAGVIYIGACFYRNRTSIKALLDGIENFSEFSQLDLKIVDKKATLFSKIIQGYSMSGMLAYALFPLLLRSRCEQNKPKYLEENDIPCGIILPAKLPFGYSKAPLSHIFITLQIAMGVATSSFMINVTMLICGLLEHAVCQLKQVRESMLKVSEHPDGKIEYAVNRAVKFHCSVIEFVDSLNESFGSQLVVHFTLTSIVISLLGFEILIVESNEEAVMYTLHLIGWFIILYNICHYGQLLIDESIGVAESAYFTPWYNSPVGVQQDIKLVILRAQTPLTLKAMNLGFLSDPTFLGVITSSYSYFTLLLKMKSA